MGSKKDRTHRRRADRRQSGVLAVEATRRRDAATSRGRGLVKANAGHQPAAAVDGYDCRVRDHRLEGRRRAAWSSSPPDARKPGMSRGPPRGQPPDHEGRGVEREGALSNAPRSTSPTRWTMVYAVQDHGVQSTGGRNGRGAGHGAVQVLRRRALNVSCGTSRRELGGHGDDMVPLLRYSTVGGCAHRMLPRG